MTTASPRRTTRPPPPRRRPPRRSSRTSTTSCPEHLKDSKATMTPSFAKKFDSIAPALQDLAPQRKIQVKATVRNAAAIECGDKCNSDKATILVFIDQARRGRRLEEADGLRQPHRAEDGQAGRPLARQQHQGPLTEPWKTPPAAREADLSSQTALASQGKPNSVPYFGCMFVKHPACFCLVCRALDWSFAPARLLRCP